MTMLSAWWLLIVLVLLLSSWIRWKYGLPSNFPPGPPGYFSFAQLRQKDQPYIFKVMVELSKTYGPIMGLRLGIRNFVCVSGYEAVRATLSNSMINGRIISFDFGLRTKGLRKGILMTDGQLWKEQRRFTVRNLKDLGFGKTSLEGLTLEEVGDLIVDIQEAIRSSVDGNIRLENTFTIASMNVMWAVVAASRVHRGDPQKEKMVNAVSGFLRSSTGTSILNVLPILRFIAPKLTGYDKLIYHVNLIRDYLKEVINEHSETLTSEMRDFLDVYLHKIKSEQDNEYSNFDHEQMMGVIIDIFVAGTETTGNLLGFALVYMIHHPDVQAKVQEEIDAVLHGNPPSLADVSRLPYTEATLMEIQRLGVVAPITVPHVAMDDTTCLGYNIPKNTMFFINLWSVSMDPALWENPTQFRPERHLDSTGKVVKSEHLLTFGLGKRICLGESLARNTIFLFFTSIMQHFRFAMPINPSDSNLIPRLDPVPGLTLGPYPCLAHVTERNLIS